MKKNFISKKMNSEEIFSQISEIEILAKTLTQNQIAEVRFFQRLKFFFFSIFIKFGKFFGFVLLVLSSYLLITPLIPFTFSFWIFSILIVFFLLMAWPIYVIWMQEEILKKLPKYKPYFKKIIFYWISFLIIFWLLAFCLEVYNIVPFAFFIPIITFVGISILSIPVFLLGLFLRHITQKEYIQEQINNSIVDGKMKTNNARGFFKELLTFPEKIIQENDNIRDFLEKNNLESIVVTAKNILNLTEKIAEHRKEILANFKGNYVIQMQKFYTEELQLLEKILFFNLWKNYSLQEKSLQEIENLQNNWWEKYFGILELQKNRLQKQKEIFEKFSFDKK